MGMENRRRAEENFGISRMVRAYEDLWESLVRGSSDSDVRDAKKPPCAGLSKSVSFVRYA